MSSASTSTRPTTMSRPTPKRAAYTWPGTAISRNHFEDFLREIGSDGESAHLCCVPKSATTHPHVHSHKRSTSNARSEVRSSLPRAADTARASSRDPSSKVSNHAQPQLPQAEKRGRTLPSPKVSGNLTSGLPVSLKSPALSSIDLESHDAPAAYDFFPSARDSLLSFMGHSPLDERPSRSPTRSFRNHTPNTSRSPDSQGLSSPSQSPSPASSLSRRELEQHSRRTASPARSSSRSPSIDSLDTASSSEAPATPKTHPMLPQDLPPVTASPLEELERSSRFRVPCVCMTCKRVGANYPSCGKCGHMWCSRECRTGAARTHVCHGRTVTTA